MPMKRSLLAKQINIQQITTRKVELMEILNKQYSERAIVIIFKRIDINKYNTHIPFLTARRKS